MHLGLIVVSLVAACFSALGIAAEVEQGAQAPLPLQPRGQYVGLIRCADCHYQQELRPGEPEDPLLPRDFVDRTEVRVWNSEDAHRKAFRVLTEALGKQIGAALGKESTRNQECLTCHSSPSVRDQGGQVGVACESCHGPGSGWLLAHSDPSWRTKSTNEKQEFGMIDMRNATVKARQCMSCHIGSPAEKKVVTHEMYAAGHPPLQSVEIEQQLSRMPAHWRNLSQKKPEIRSSLRYDPNEKYRTKSVLVGGVLASRTWLSQLAAHSPAAPQSLWSEFAVYDCYSCHHDLNPDKKAITWRQRRGFAGVAGRPHLPMWPQTLVKAALFQSAGGNTENYRGKLKEFNDKVDRVTRSHNGKSYPAQKALPASERETATSDLIAWLDRLLVEIQNSRFDRAATVRLMQTLVSTESPESLDYPSARQIGGALASLAEEAQLGDARVGTVINEMKDSLGLQTKGRVLINKWQAPNSFEPGRFKDQLGRLAPLLKK